MEKLLITPISSEAQYVGTLRHLAFGILASPAPLYQNILDNLGKYGASLAGLRLDAAVLADANVSCTFLGFNVLLRIRLDSWSVMFFKLNEIGQESAQKILLDSWTAIEHTDPNLETVRHQFSVAITAEIKNSKYEELIQRYVRVPDSLPRTTNAGIVIYFPEDQERGEGEGSLAIDRVPGHIERLTVRLNGNFDAQKVSLPNLAKRTEDFITRNLDKVGLSMGS